MKEKPPIKIEMPMLMQNPKSIPNNFKKVTKSGADIDEVVRNSFTCAVKNSLSRFSKNTVDCITKVNRTSRLTDKQSKMCKIIPVLKTKTHSINSNNKSPKIPKLDENGKVIVKRESPDDSLNCLDDSLTNLQWLTDVKVNDILDGKPLPYTPLSPAPSNSSDDDDEKRCYRRDMRYYSDSSVDYRTNRHVKPPYSYAALIIMAMKSKSCAKMTLSEIYKWIMSNFVFYKHADPSWQNSIRHNLSLNKCFAKIPRNKGDPGKGGYWRIVPEFANKLLESSIRKRRSTMLDYSCQDIIKRQKLDLFENQLLCKIKPEVKDGADVSRSVSCSSMPFQNSNRHTPIQADLDQCRMDHPYGKNPYVKYDSSDEENIKALADNLQATSSNVDICSVSTSVNSDGLSNSQVFNTFSSAIVSDCIWSSQQMQNDNLTESMTKVTEELLEARNHSTTESPLLSKTLAHSLNSSGSLIASPFCLSPPLSGDDDTFSDDLDDTPPVFTDDVNLTVRGTSMTLFEPTSEMMVSYSQIKEEPPSPQSVDLEG